MAKTRFRVRFDLPYFFAVEPGFERYTHCQDFRAKSADLNHTYQDPKTGLIMLEPSWITADRFNVGWKDLSQWTKGDADIWQEAKRLFNPDSGSYGAPLLTTVSKPGTSFFDALATATAKPILAAPTATDALEWALESDEAIPRDGGFVIPHHFMGDELQRCYNLLGIQWADIFLHLSGDGFMRCFVYPDGDTTATPEPFDEFQIASPGDIVGRMGYFIIYPIPGYGLAIYHSLSAQRIDSFLSSATAGVTRGHLVPLPYKVADNDGLYQLEESVVRIALHKNLDRFHNELGFHQITYAPSGSFTAERFDIGFIPSSTPSVPVGLVKTEPFYAGTVGGSGSLRNGDNTGAWTAGVDQQARSLVTLTTSDPNYTPFLLTTGAVWNPVFSTRNTTPKIPDTLLHLEFSDSDEGRFEGTAIVLMESEENRLLCERGDTTFVVEETTADDPEEGDWSTVCDGRGGGLARISDDVQELFASGRLYYIAKWQLYDLLAARTKEVHILGETAFDALTPGDSINSVFRCSALPQLASIPAEFTAFTLPPNPKGQNWRFGPRVGEEGDEIIRELLLYLRKQWSEWRLYWDWDGQQWVLEKKPRDISVGATWTLSPWSDEVYSSPDDLNSPRVERRVRVGEENKIGSFLPLPPEANMLRPYGMTSTQAPEAERVPGTVMVNVPSIGDPDSVDYLGRVVAAFPFFPGVVDVDGPTGINQMTRRVYDASCHRRLKFVRTGFNWHSDFRPSSYVILRTMDAGGNRIDFPVNVWLRRRSVVADYSRGGDIAPVVTYHLDSSWVGEIK